MSIINIIIIININIIVIYLDIFKVLGVKRAGIK